MKINDPKVEEQQNKSLLAFFLAVHNRQVKAANFFLKTYDQLRILLTGLHEQMSNKDFSGSQNASKHMSMDGSKSHQNGSEEQEEEEDDEESGEDEEDEEDEEEEDESE